MPASPETTNAREERLFARNGRGFWEVLAGFVIIAYVVGASLRPSSPGLHYDEMNFVPAALREMGNPWVYRKAFGIPLMIMPYIGALKSWIYTPIFALFGVSAATVRIPAVLITGITLWLGYDTVRRLLGGPAAFAFTLLCAVSPALFVLCRLDWGPVVLMLFFKALCLNLVIRQRETQKLRPLGFSLAAFGLGFFDKLNFIWYLVPHVASVAIFARNIEWRNLLRNRAFVTTVSAIAAVLAIIGITVIRPLLRFPHPHPVPLVQRLQEVNSLFVRTFDGRAAADFVWNDLNNSMGIRSGAWPWIWLLVGAGLLFGVAAIWRGGFAKAFAKPQVALAVFAAFTLLFIFSEVAITPQGGGPHHLMMLFPYPQLILVALLSAAFRNGLPAKLPVVVARVACGTGLACFLFFDASATSRHLFANYNRRITNRVWTPAIYELADTVRRMDRQIDKVIVADWGIGNQLSALLGKEDRLKTMDAWAMFYVLGKKNDQSVRAALRAMLGDSRIMIVSYVENLTTFPECYRNVDLALDMEGRSISRRTFINGPDGKPCYEIRWVEAKREKTGGETAPH